MINLVNTDDMTESAHRTLTLQEITPTNFNDCISLKRDSCRFVGDAESVLAQAYIYRDDSLAYAICFNETIIGLVIIRVSPTEVHPYSFTELFIADDFQRQGFGKQTVEAILDKFRNEKKSQLVRIQVHQNNDIAIRIYKKCGFTEVKRAEWNNDFLVMELVL